MDNGSLDGPSRPRRVAQGSTSPRRHSARSAAHRVGGRLDGVRSGRREGSLIADAWTRAVRGIVKRVPPGRVATYGLVAMVAGRPLAARAVGNVMRACDDPRVPCHRVVRASGLPAFARHRALLRREGVHFAGPRVDMTRDLWMPRLPQ